MSPVNKSQYQLAPSILSADFARLGDQVKEATDCGADIIHVDIMDGHFVPTLTWGPQTVSALKKWTHLPLDVHMMVQEPERHIDSFLEAGSDIITVHAEACTHIHWVINKIKEHGSKASVAINPGTPISVLDSVFQYLDQILVMTVNPGLPRQRFIPEMGSKIQKVSEQILRCEYDIKLQVDGGINISTIGTVVERGADIVVAGSAIFEDPDGIGAAINKLRQAGSNKVSNRE